MWKTLLLCKYAIRLEVNILVLESLLKYLISEPAMCLLSEIVDLKDEIIPIVSQQMEKRYMY